jgi:hypothetical protein
MIIAMSEICKLCNGSGIKLVNDQRFVCDCILNKWQIGKLGELIKTK